MEHGTLDAGAGYPGVQHACHTPILVTVGSFSGSALARNPPRWVFDTQPGSIPCTMLFTCYSVPLQDFSSLGEHKSLPLLHLNTSSWQRHPLPHQGLMEHCGQYWGCQAGSSAPLSCKKPLWKEGIMSCSLAVGSSMSLCSQGPGSLDGDHPNPGDSWGPPSLPGLDETACPSLSRGLVHHLQDMGTDRVLVTWLAASTG